MLRLPEVREVLNAAEHPVRPRPRSAALHPRVSGVGQGGFLHPHNAGSRGVVGRWGKGRRVSRHHFRDDQIVGQGLFGFVFTIGETRGWGH